MHASLSAPLIPLKVIACEQNASDVATTVAYNNKNWYLVDNQLFLNCLRTPSTISGKKQNL